MSNDIFEPMPHNGDMLRKIMKEKRFSQADMASYLSTNQTFILRQLEKHSIKTIDLWKMGKVLKINLLQELAKQHPIQTPSNNELALQQRVTDLEKEVAIYKALLQGKIQ